jgi:tetratricopeptide (TPR) repeat protein
MADAYIILGGNKFQTGEFAECFEFFTKAFDLIPKFESEVWSKFYLSMYGKLYFAVGDYNTALDYFRLAFNQSLLTAERRRIQANVNIWATTELAGAYAIVGKYDSAKLCYDLIDTSKGHWKDLRVFLVSLGEFYSIKGEHVKALSQFHRALPYHQAINDRSQVIRTQLGIAKSYLGLNKIDQTIAYATSALQIAIETFARKYKMDAYELLYKAYDKKNNGTQSNAYFRLFTTMKDSVALDNLRGRVAAVKYENLLSSLASEKVITSQRMQIQKQSLQQAEVVKKMLIAGLVLIVLLAIVGMRNVTLKRKKIQTEMRGKAAELEMAALRSQMNPHFIFNCLNAINHFVLSNNIDSASDYLIKFSKLIRLVLQTSSQKFVLLNEELETLRLYVELEQLRFKKQFEFIIDVDENLDPETILIPPMLIQPFVENAIWHGLMQSDRPGVLNVSINTAGAFLVCSVQDNGIGRTESQRLKSKTSQFKKSMGVDITHNRLKLMNDETSINDRLKISDVVSEQGNCIGTRVEITIPLQSQHSLQET